MTEEMRPPPTDTAWLQKDARDGNWVLRVETAPHVCAPPTRGAGEAVPGTLLERKIPSAERGSLWRCDCGRLWRVAGVGSLVWMPATRWQRLRHLNDRWL